MSAVPSAVRPRRRIIPAAEAQAWLDGYGFLAEAQRTASEMQQRAAEAYETERLRGIEAGQREGAAALAAMLAEATAKIDQAFASAESEIAATIVATVERILGGFDQRDLLVHAAGHAVAQMRDARHLTLRVSAQQAAEIEERLPSVLGGSATLVTVVGDPRLDPDAAVLESELGFVALGIAAQLAALRRGFGLEVMP